MPSKEYRALHPDRCRTYAKTYADKHRGRLPTDEYKQHRGGILFKSHLKTRFGITVNEYTRLLEAQGGVCAVCGRLEHVHNRGGGIKRLSVDHDHETGRVRGLLCHDCNVCVGLLDERRLRRAAAYLSRTNAT